MIRRCAGILACLLLTGVGEAGAREDASAQTQAARRLVLMARPKIGFPPLKVTLSATLSGVPSDDPDFCHVDQIWIGKMPDPRRPARTSVRRPRCRHSEEERRVELRFFKDLTLFTPGSYTYRLRLEPKHGPAVHSNPVTLHVLPR
ncbi:MAG: hypothetical protein V3U98_03270 [Acidobacteriota bacterium]